MEVHGDQLDSVADVEKAGRRRTSSSIPIDNIRSSTARVTDDKAMVEITLEIGESSISLQKVKGGDAETATWAKRLERRASSLGSELSFRVRQVSQEIKRLTSLERFRQVRRISSGATRALKGIQFMSKNVCSKSWNDVESRFENLAVNGFLLRSQFGDCIGMTVLSSSSARMTGTAEFSGHLFDGLARRRNITTSSITKEELHQFWEQLIDQSFDARLRTFFDLVDKNADGRITKEEVREVIYLSASANELTKILDRLDEYTKLIMEGLDPDDVGYVEIDSLEYLLLHTPSQSFSFDLHEDLGKILVPTKEPSPIKRWYRKVKYFTEDNWRRIWVVALWLSVCAGLFTWKFIEYKHHQVFDVMGYCVTTAKASAETLKFNMALILFAVCRKTLTWLRTRTKLGVVVPFDDNINFHKVIAIGIAIGVGLHAGAHLACDFPRLLRATDDEYEPLKPFFGEDRPPNYWWFLKGTEGWTGIVMVVLMGIAYTLAQHSFRRDKFVKFPKILKKLTGFNAFWYSHHLFVIVYVLFIIHGIHLYLSREWHKKTTWMYLAGPIILYGCERLIRSFRSRFNTVNILKVALHPGDVLELRLSKPEGFRYKSGQYIFVKCSAISLFQWHPFSLNSAPEDCYLSIHIKNLGDWTEHIRALFSKEYQATTGDGSGGAIVDMVQGNETNIPRLKLLMDGPYGAPSQDYSKYEVLLLIGLGIGATPMISIVKDILNNIKQLNGTNERHLESGTITRNKRNSVATSRAYFHWVTEKQGHFEWFEKVLNEVTENDQNEVIELHNYCTSVYKEGDARSAFITMLQSLQHEKTGIDVVAGTHARTHFGRPDWGKVFEHVVSKHPNQRVGVFYCGRPKLIKELRRLAQDFSLKSTTKFEFHKENF